MCVRVGPSPNTRKPTVSLAPDIAVVAERNSKEVLEAVTGGVESACLQGELGWGAVEGTCNQVCYRGCMIMGPHIIVLL